MNDYTPTTKTVLAYIRGNAVMAGATASEAQDAAVGWLASVEWAAAEKARRDLMLELLPVLEDAVSNVYLCQNDRGVGNEWDDEIKRAEAALERAEAYRQERKEQ